MKINSHISLPLYIVTPWMIIALLRWSDLIRYHDLSASIIIYLFLLVGISVVFSVIGLAYGQKKQFAKNVLVKSNKKRELNLMAVFASIFVVLMIYDYFFVKDGSLSSITEIREQDNLIGARMSVIGGVIALLSASPYLLLSVIWFQELNLNEKRVKYLLAIAVIGVGSGFLTGGRNAFVIGACVLFLQYIIVKDGSNKRVIKSNSLVKITFLTALMYSLYIFAEREMIQGVEAYDILHYAANKWGVDVVELATKNSLLNVLYAVLIILVYYFTHPLSYLDAYFIGYTHPSLLGAYNFPIVAKIVEIVFGGDAFSRISESLETPGVYLTFPGSLYVDFGYGGSIIISAVLAFLTGFMYGKRRGLEPIDATVLSFMLTMWVLAPLYSIVGISNGLSYLVLIFALKINSKIR